MRPQDLIGRSKELAELTALLAENGQLVLVNGMGGIGKTSLAAAYVAQEYDNYQHIAWISNNSADIADDILQSRDLLQSLELNTLTGDREVILGAVLHKLRSIDERPKLFVIDNAAAEIERRLPQLPSQPNWHVLITSREEIAGTHSMPLDFLQPSDAVALFKKHCHRIEAEDEIQQIVAAVDYHTLTIEILARTAQLQRTKLDELLSAIRNDARANVRTAHSNQAKIERVRSYLETIFDFSGLNNDELWLLKQFVALPPEFQPYELLVELIEPEQLGRIQTFSELLDNLAGKGWLLCDEKRNNFKMHRVVQEAFREKLKITPHDIESLLTNVTSKLSVDQTKDNPVDKFLWIPYGEAVELIVGQFQEPMVGQLQGKLGWVLQDFGDYAGAKTLLERALASDEKNFGVANPETAVSCANLAQVLRDLGEYNRAAELLKRALEIAETTLGVKHLTTATRCSNLGLVYQALGDYVLAKKLFERALSIEEEKLGAEHSTTAVSYANLGSVLHDLGQNEKAKELLELALVSDKKNFGADHPKIAVRSSNLALVLQDLGQNDKAKELLEHAMAYYQRDFGPNHPTTAIISSNLASVHQALGDYGAAKELLESAMRSAEEHFGIDNPTTAVRYSNLGSVLQKLGDHDGAKEMLERAFVILEKNLGADHPTTALTCSNLGMALGALGDYAGAMNLLKRAMTINEQIFGKDHPTTALGYFNMAAVLDKLGEIERAWSMASKALRVFENKLPAGHPHTEMAIQQVSNLQAQLEAQKQQ